MIVTLSFGSGNYFSGILGRVPNLLTPRGSQIAILDTFMPSRGKVRITQQWFSSIVLIRIKGIRVGASWVVAGIVRVTVLSLYQSAVSHRQRTGG